MFKFIFYQTIFNSTWLLINTPEERVGLCSPVSAEQVKQLGNIRASMEGWPDSEQPRGSLARGACNWENCCEGMLVPLGTERKEETLVVWD